MIRRIMQIEEVRITPSEICTILHIIQKPNSIIVLLFIQNISKSPKDRKCIKMANHFGVEFSLIVAKSSAVAGFWMFLS